MKYSIFTTKYDEVVRPLDLVPMEELVELSSKFHVLCPVEDFEPLKERLETLKTPSVPTMVTLLVDNSGSMRGSSISFAIGAVGIISMYLDRLGVPNEILGFTTSAWKGGEPREEWINEGRKSYPGRLCPLRHIVYKEASEQLQDVRHNLALMLKEGILKENVDGEAVQWACERLRSVDTAERKILMVISDGAPMDDATASVNSFSMLQDHLHHVVDEIVAAGDIELDAIGINHNVRRYYGVGDTVDRVRDLAPIAIKKLEKLLAKNTEADDLAIKQQRTQDWLDGRNAALDELKSMMETCPHLVSPIFIPTADGLKTTLLPPSFD